MSGSARALEHIVTHATTAAMPGMWFYRLTRSRFNNPWANWGLYGAAPVATNVHGRIWTSARNSGRLGYKWEADL